MTVRLTDFADLTGRPRETIRNLTKAGALPWPEDGAPEGGHRRFDGAHAFALVTAEVLVAQGGTFEASSEVVRARFDLLETFLTAVERGADLPQTFIASWRVPEECSLSGPRWTPILGIGGAAEELVEAFRHDLAQVGQVREAHNGRATVRRIGGPNVALVSLPECYRLVQLRARAAGFVVDGRRIARVEGARDG